MDILKIVLIVYGILCILIGLFKLPLVWNIKKLQTMKKMFNGDRNLQIFIIVWGLIVGTIGILIH
jgi:vacuolar-type H+-ATPase subunit I/STV1